MHFLAILAVAQATAPSQIELNGFLLGQYAKAPDGTFGEPYQIQTTEDHWTDRVYIFDKKHDAYMAFQFSASDPERIVSIQIAGDSGTQMRPFLGLMLGDDKEKVRQILGRPTKVEAETDYPVDLWTYADRNYSVEINKEGRLSSIKVMGYEGFPLVSDAATPPDISALRQAVVSRDVNSLMTLIAGDLEIYRGEQTIDFTTSARMELEDPDSPISRVLFAAKGSLRVAFTAEKFEPEPQIRIYEKAPPGSVVKFEHSKIVKEVVYKIEGGAWKVWEIRMR